MATFIHPTSEVSPKAQLGEDIYIGPFCRVHENVSLGDRCLLDSHVVVGALTGETILGKENKIYGFSLIGGPPQDLKYKGEKTQLVLGDHNIIRESVTLNIGTAKGRGKTTIGDNNLIMAYCHVGHDCQVGNSAVLANQVQLAGHVIVEDRAVLGALTAINQFVRIGRNSFIGGGSMINKDILPFAIAQGNYARVRAVNKIGLQRAGFSEASITQIRRAIRILTMGSDTVTEALGRIEAECEHLPEVDYLLDFVKSSQRGLGL